MAKENKFSTRNSGSSDLSTCIQSIGLKTFYNVMEHTRLTWLFQTYLLVHGILLCSLAHGLKNMILFCNYSLGTTRVNPKVSGLAAWKNNFKWYSSLPLDAVIALFCESV
jgi:hypothetical protein